MSNQRPILEAVGAARVPDAFSSAYTAAHATPRARRIPDIARHGHLSEESRKSLLSLYQRINTSAAKIAVVGQHLGGLDGQGRGA